LVTEICSTIGDIEMSLKTLVNFKGQELQLPSSSFQGLCKKVDGNYRKLNRIGEGTYGIVYRACQVSSGEIIALKRIRMDHGEVSAQEGLPLSSLREISLLRKLSHPNIVQVKDVTVGQSLSDIFMGNHGKYLTLY
jgi:cyclin-dependent kinase 10